MVPWWFLNAALLLEANLSLLDISTVMSSNFTGAGQIYEQDLHCAHLYALAENASCGPYSPMPYCSQVQLLIKANFRDVKLMSSRVPLEMCSSRRQFTASTSGPELPFREDCLPADCKVSREAEQHQLLQILLPPPPLSHISMLQGKRLSSLNCQMGTLKEAMCTVTEQAADTQTGAEKHSSACSCSSAPSLALV